MAPVVPFLADTSGPFSQLLATEHTAQTVQACIQERKDVIHAIKRQAIDEDTPFEAIYDHLKQLEGDIGRFKRLLQSNEALRADWRQVHMAAWRGATKPLKVTDLPNEILTTIFANLQDAPVARIRTKRVAVDDALPSPDVASIQSVRLTCRAFCDSGSRFLLPVVNIAFTAASIQRLQDISGNATISKGVRVLRLHANPYSALRANDETGLLFRQQLHSRLSVLGRIMEQTNAARHRLDKDLLWQFWVQLDPESGVPRVSDDELPVAMEKIHRVFEIMNKMENQQASPLSPPEIEVKGFIDQAHKEYRRRYLEQRDIMRDTNTSVIIHKAISHMPSIQTLCVPSLGWDHTFKSGWDNRYDMRKLKCDNMDMNYVLGVMGYDDGKESSMRSRLVVTNRHRTVALLHMLPDVLGAANGTLSSLDIDLPMISEKEMGYLMCWIPYLRSSCRNLRCVRITVTDLSKKFAQAQTRSPTYTILDAILSSPRLEAVSLYCSRRNTRRKPTDNTMSIGPVLEHLPWDRLRSFCLKDVSVKLGELQKFLEKVSGKIHLDLEGIYLMEGTWDEALEVLRGRADHSSRVVDPLGAQLDTIPVQEGLYLRSEFDSEHRDGWYSFQTCPGPASFYIRGGNIPNPLIQGSD